MNSLLYWSDHRLIYFTTVYGLLCCLILFCLLPVLRAFTGNRMLHFLSSDFIFASFAFLFILLSRWPSLFWYKGFSIDEDQFLSAAWVLLNDPVFFRNVETGSSGPMNIYPIILSQLFGIYPGFISMRLISLILLSSAILLAYFAMRKIVMQEFARCGALISLTLYGLTSFWDFSGYSSEIPSLFYISIGIFCISLIWASNPLNKFLICLCSFLGAFSLSLVPFAKLQSIYLGMTVGGILVLAITTKPETDWSTRLRALGFMLVGVFMFPVFFCMIMYVSGSFEYFFKSYLLNAIAYVELGHQYTNPLHYLWGITKKSIDFQIQSAGFVFILISIVALMTAIAPKAWFRKVDWPKICISILLLLVSIYTVLSPKRDWAHYLLYVPIFMGIFVSFLLATALRVFEDAKSSNLLRAIPFVLFFASSVAPLSVYRLVKTNPWIGTAKAWHPVHGQTYSSVGKSIEKAFSGTVGTLCIWGYNPDYHTETKLLQANRLNISSAQFNKNDLQGFFRATYLEDLKKNRPYVFVDATAVNQFPALNDPEKFRHEVIPEVRDFVAANYELFEEIDGVRIYRWRELR